jgi:hypothetical protein
MRTAREEFDADYVDETYAVFPVPDARRPNVDMVAI